MSVTVRDYLRRLELASAPSPDLAGLTLLHQRHLLRVPFENFDVRNGVPIELDHGRLLDKIVTRRRGGFCYELNGCLAWLLERLGFTVTLLSARVFDDDLEPSAIEFDHLCLRVDLDRPWLCDVGFGRSFFSPLALDSSEEVRQLTGTWRVVDDDAGAKRLEEYDRLAMKHRPIYLIDPRARRLAEFADACRHHQSSPDSHFTRRTICSIAAPDGRVTLTEDKLMVTRNRRRSEEPIADAAARRAALRRYFGIDEDV